MKRGAVIAVAAAGAAVLIGAGAAWWAFSRPASAQDAAESYLQALESGDAGALAPLLPDGQQTQALLASFVGADAYVEDAALTGTTVEGDRTVAEASVQLDGTASTIQFALSTEAGRWQLAGDDHVVTIDVATTLGDAVQIGDALVPLAPDGVVHVLPALYTLHAAPVDFLDGAATVAATHGQPSAAIEAALVPDAAARAQPQLDAYADACAAPATAVPQRCALEVPWPADLAELASLRLRIEAYPQLSIDPATLTFTAIDGTIVATATGTTRAGTEESFTYRTDAWTLRGAVAFHGDEMVLTVF
ncbi:MULTISPECIES: hypothetical protein [unclassified Microbacterium]|uniref:hypothetical protein n=1 Tax=unclassified Microbacterium TaxID=2609290 RepID=UPI00214C0A20|nr:MULTISPECIES: hypothetical protein [unclassified Microbacterium]MCR2784353.1 hypothetical protein [Microbacterium sp. zg.B96]WIM14823.1 hypothetical protein QNO11_09650 [Microbacterium sp. zg-B96]